MIKVIKKYLIPHKENDFRPHVLREEGVLAVLALSLVLFLGFFTYSAVLTRLDLLASILPKVLVDFSNQGRLENYAGSLAINPILEEAARRKAEDMARAGYFAHVSPDGKRPWDFIKEAGYNFSHAGENLALDFSDSQNVYRAWMDSSSHRANILNKNFTEIGIATARGVYQGRETTYVVQMFARPALVPLSDTTGDKPAALQVASGLPSALPEAGVLSEMFIATDGAEEEAGGLTEETHSYAPAVAELATSPHKVLGWLYLILAALVFLVSAISMFYEIHRQHPRHIAYAAFMLIFISLLAYSSGLVFSNVLIV